MTAPIRGAIAAAGIAVVGVTLTACAGSSTSPRQRAARTAGATNIALLREVRAARASSPQLSIFPVSIRGRKRCAIPLVLGGLSTSTPPSLHGTCQTRVHLARNTHEPLTIVVFSETWHWRRGRCMPGCPVLMPRHDPFPKPFHSWIVWVKPPMILGEKPVVLATHQRGNAAPQAPKE
jgi:hypothetical protein